MESGLVANVALGCSTVSEENPRLFLILSTRIICSLLQGNETKAYRPPRQ